MNYCLIHNLYPPNAVGGAEQVVIDQAKAFQKEGHSVVVITMLPWNGMKSTRPEKTVEQGITVYRFFPPNIFSYQKLSRHGIVFKLFWHVWNMWNVLSASSVRCILLAEKPDVVVTHNLMGLGFGIPRVIRKLNIKHIHTLHDVQLVDPSGVLPWNHTTDTLFQRMYSACTKHRFGSPATIISPTKFLHEFYTSRGFFPRSQWEDTPLPDVVALDIKIKKPIFLFAGSLSLHKGIDVLMRAWDALPADFPGTLHIAGDGALKEKVQAWVKNHSNVIYHGRLSARELDALYKEVVLLVFPSVCMENRPRVIEETLARHVWILASRTGGVPELVEDAVNGNLLTPGSVEELTNAILSIS